MMQLTSARELIRDIRNLGAQGQVMRVLKEYLPAIIEKSGVRSADEIFQFITECSYQLLPFPIRMLIKEDVYVSVVTDNKDKVIRLISNSIA